MNGHAVIEQSYLEHAFKGVLSTPSISSQDNQRMDGGPVDGGTDRSTQEGRQQSVRTRDSGDLLGSR